MKKISLLVLLSVLALIAIPSTTLAEEMIDGDVVKEALYNSSGNFRGCHSTGTDCPIWN